MKKKRKTPTVKNKNQIEATKIANDTDVELLNSIPLSGNPMAIMMQAQKYSGPLPTAEQFKLYESAHSGAAQRILNYMDAEQTHRHQMEELMVKASIDESRTGQYFGFFITMGLLIAACLAAVNNYPVLAALFLASGAIGIVKKFIDGRKNSGSQSP